MARLYQDKLDRIAAMAGRADGVSNKEVQDTFGCCVKVAAVLLSRTALDRNLARARAPSGRLRFFSSTHAARTWLGKEAARLEAAQRALARIKHGAAAQKAQQRTEQAEQRAAARRLVAQQQAEQKAAQRAEKKAATKQAKRAQIEAAAAQAKADRRRAVPSTERAHAGLFDSGRRERAPAPLTAAQLFAQATPVTTPNTKYTVHSTTPEAHRVNRMADPLPTVPGWATGPAIRPGALDFKRYQHHGPLAPLTGKGRAA